jgi:hypothetical protein
MACCSRARVAMSIAIKALGCLAVYGVLIQARACPHVCQSHNGCQIGTNCPILRVKYDKLHLNIFKCSFPVQRQRALSRGSKPQNYSNEDPVYGCKIGPAVIFCMRNRTKSFLLIRQQVPHLFKHERHEAQRQQQCEACATRITLNNLYILHQGSMVACDPQHPAITETNKHRATRESERPQLLPFLLSQRVRKAPTLAISAKPDGQRGPDSCHFCSARESIRRLVPFLQNRPISSTGTRSALSGHSSERNPSARSSAGVVTRQRLAVWRGTRHTDG